MGAALRAAMLMLPVRRAWLGACKAGARLPHSICSLHVLQVLRGEIAAAAWTQQCASRHAAAESRVHQQENPPTLPPLAVRRNRRQGDAAAAGRACPSHLGGADTPHSGVTTARSPLPFVV
jgi:hypothetical protein